MSNANNIPAPKDAKTAADFKVVEAAAPVDVFANLNVALDKLHHAFYALSTSVNEVVKQVRETQRNVKLRDRSFKELQTTIERFKKVANF